MVAFVAHFAKDIVERHFHVLADLVKDSLDVIARRQMKPEHAQRERDDGNRRHPKAFT
ncbi:hypothetical protein [Caballeronia sp. S22]|uniref:hypothetical protein n=1 Tax=Caballeronia sp. S22 TaxID=3137182 RepID=UPI0035310533